MTDRGVVCRGLWQGEEVLGVRLSWSKRYITLAPVATLIGLAFRLYDPEGLLGAEVPEGAITLALVPADAPGVRIGRRHYPLGLAFMNGPVQGHDVFLPLEAVIGGREGVGRGWRMLMECLAEGRGISLPALSVAAAKLACREVGAYARVRQQFSLPVARFEGVQEALGRMAGRTYWMDAARRFLTVGLDAGERPAVASAILKYHLTESMRRVVADGMDVRGGSGICLGPRNRMGLVWQAVPVGITVEGANILAAIPGCSSSWRRRATKVPAAGGAASGRSGGWPGTSPAAWRGRSGTALAARASCGCPAAATPPATCARPRASAPASPRPPTSRCSRSAAASSAAR